MPESLQYRRDLATATTCGDGGNAIHRLDNGRRTGIHDVRRSTSSDGNPLELQLPANRPDVVRYLVAIIDIVRNLAREHDDDERSGRARRPGDPDA